MLERAGRFTAGNFSVFYVDVIRFTHFGDNSALRKVFRSLQFAIIDIFEELHWDEPGRENDLVMLPTGDGYGVAFEAWISDIDILRYAVKLSNVMRSEGYPVRIGINKGPCFVHTDLNDHLNLVGWGIIDAANTVSCGDKNHILCTNEFAKVCLDMKADPNFHDVGEFVIRDRRLHLFNYYSKEFGNSQPPIATRRKQSKAKR
jgi:hypothetical protein